jgi:hypothetical protein
MRATDSIAVTKLKTFFAGKIRVQAEVIDVPNKRAVGMPLMAASVAFIAIAGCAREKSVTNTHQAEAMGDRNVATAQRKVDVTAAEAARNIARQRCEVEAGAALAACRQQAEIEFETVKSELRAEEEASRPPMIIVPR